MLRKMLSHCLWYHAPKPIKSFIFEYFTWDKVLCGCSWEKNESVLALSVTLQTSKLSRDAMCDRVYTMMWNFGDYLRDDAMAQRWDPGSNALISDLTAYRWACKSLLSVRGYSARFGRRHLQTQIINFCVWRSISFLSHCIIPQVVAKVSHHSIYTIAHSIAS